MPRRDRFAPRFDERLRQSRVARGLEQAPPAPEPRVEHRSAFDWGQIIAGDLVDTTLRDYWESIGRLQQEAYARMYGRAPAQLIVDPGSLTGRITPRPDRYAHVPVDTPVAPPERKEPQSMNQQTEQTAITVLQQAVADTIYFIQRIKERCIEYGVKPRVTERYTGSNRSDYSHPGYAFYNTGHLRIDHDSSLSLGDTWRQLVFLDCYGHRTTIQVQAVVLRHVAVLNAIDDLMKTRRAYTPAEREAFLADARRKQITDFEEYFKDAGDIFAIATCPVQPSAMSATYIQQLNLPGNHIHHRDNIANDNVVYFGPTTPFWRVREALRMKHGEYTALPAEVLALLPQEVIDTQFPHVATKAGNAGMIAYTQSPVAGMLDRQQVIKPGRYIRQHNDAISDEQVKQAAASCVAASAAGFHHSKDADDFARIYIDGPSSCMAYDEDGKYFRHLMVDGEFFHPARIYAHPENDIEIVWLEVAGRIAARAVINTANKTYPRVYGSDSVRGAYSRLVEYLEAIGYRQMDGALSGQKLLKVHPDKFPEAIICPYIDCGNLGVEIHDGHLIAGGEYDADHETGCLNRYNTSDEDEYTWDCERCGDSMTDDDSQYDTNDGHVCRGCIDCHYSQVHDVEADYTRYINDSEVFYNCLLYTSDAADE